MNITFHKKRRNLANWLSVLFDHRDLTFSDADVCTLIKRIRHKPSQIEVFWISDIVDCQLFYISNAKTRKDRGIIINGPVTFSEAISFFSKSLERSQHWKKKIDDLVISKFPGFESTFTRGQAFAQLISNLLEFYKMECLSPIKKERFSKQHRFLNDSWVAFFKGDISASKTITPTPPVSIIEKNEAYTKRNVIDLTQGETQYCAAYIFPFININDRIIPTIQERITNSFYQNQHVAIKETLVNLPTYITNTGMVVLETTEKPLALKILNQLMGGLIVRGHYAESVKLVELIKGSGTGGVLAACEYNLGTRKNDLHGIISTNDYLLRSIKVINEKLIRDAVLIVNSLNPNQQVYLELLSNAATHFVQGELNQAFFVSWMIVESYVSSVYIDKLKEEPVKQSHGINTKRLSKFTRPGGNYTLDHYIEILQFVKIIDLAEYQLLMRLKNKRNKLIHQLELITDKKVVHELIEYCIHLIRNLADAGVATSS